VRCAVDEQRWNDDLRLPKLQQKSRVLLPQQFTAKILMMLQLCISRSLTVMERRLVCSRPLAHSNHDASDTRHDCGIEPLSLAAPTQGLTQRR
jgi:hypothetical protein